MTDPRCALVPARARARHASQVRVSWAAALLVGLSLFATGCGSGGAGGAGQGSQGSLVVPASFDPNHPSPAGFFVDPNEGGSSSNFKLVNLYWGRLVDIYSLDSATGEAVLQHRDFVIGEDIRSDGLDYLLETNPVTEQTSLTILHQAGSAKYQAAFGALEINIGPVQPKSLEPSELPPFSFVPRNAALVLQFSDLLDLGSVNDNTVQVLTGYAPTQPFDARLIPDPNHGGLLNATTFGTTRLIIDTTVSQVEAQSSPVAVAVNSLGLPASLNTAQPNVGVRIPTALNFSTGQFQLLTNASGHPLANVGDGPVDFGVPTFDVVRALRAGGDLAVTNDQNNGFLLDLNAPRVLGSQPITVTSVVPDPAAGQNRYRISITFASVLCSSQPEPGDVIKQPGIFAEVVQLASTPQQGVVSNISVELLTPEAADSFIAGQGVFVNTFDSADGDKPQCFVTFSPTPGDFPNNKVDPNSQLSVAFSEPLDPASVAPFDTFTVTTTSTNFKPTEFVVGEVLFSSDLKEFRFTPILPLAHSASQADRFFFTLVGGADGVTDLAGNALGADLPQVEFRLDPAAGDEKNGGLVLRFSDIDEDDNGFPEVRGQMLYDLDRGVLRSRPVSRFSATADRSQALISRMIPVPTGLQTPLSNLGSRMMTVWRYGDVGFGATDEANHNLDVEGLNWAPLNGLVVADIYEEFEMYLSHCVRNQDEAINAALLPLLPGSGFFDDSFEQNVLIDDNSPQVKTHDRSKGYVVNPLDLVQVASGTRILPFPMNQDGDSSDYVPFIWRDTAAQGVGGTNSDGIDLNSMVASGLSLGPVGGIAPADLDTGQVPTVGLPLLMEFRCFPSDSALGLNSLDCSIAINSSIKPYFRNFSSGGFNGSGTAIEKNPDLEAVPDGGFNQTTASGLPIGAQTPGSDPVVYIGQMDYVVRVTRAHTIFFDTLHSGPDYQEPVLEPRNVDQPAGTSLVVAFRGAVAITGQGLVRSTCIDAYGDVPIAGDCDVFKYGKKYPDAGDSPVTFNIGGGSLTYPLVAPGGFEDPTWKADIDQIDGLRFFQMRFTFLNNIDTGLTPELSAVGISFLKP